MHDNQSASVFLLPLHPDQLLFHIFDGHQSKFIHIYRSQSKITVPMSHLECKTAINISVSFSLLDHPSC